jgi:hypothetical protein
VLSLFVTSCQIILLYIVWTDHTYVVHGMEPSNYDDYKVRTLRTYAFYSLDLSILYYLQHGYIKLTFFYNIDPLNLCCLRNGPIKLMLCSEWKHQTYGVYSMTIFVYDKTNTITLLTVWTHPTFCTTIYQKQYYKCYCNNFVYSPVRTSHQHKLHSNNLQNIK